MTQRESAVNRIMDKAEERERAKVKRALEKWLPLRRAQLALASNSAASDAKLAADLLDAYALDEKLASAPSTQTPEVT